MHEERVALDGNAAAGVFQDIFAFDITIAEVRCAQCGAIGPVGALRAYALEMGAVLRCLGCESVVIRLASLPHGRWLDCSGAAAMRLPAISAT